MGWRDNAKPVKSDWRSTAKPTPEQALVDAIKAKRAKLPPLPEGAGISPEDQRALMDLPGHARSALMGLTSNAGDRIESFVDAATQNPNEQQGWVFDNSDAIHGKYMKSVADHPVSNVVGSIAQPSPLGKASAASKLGKVGLAAARVGQAGANSALSDYLGNSEPEALGASYVDRANVPMAIQAGAEVVSPVLGKMAGGLRTLAGRSAANAAGLRGGIVNQAKRAGISTIDELGDESIPKLGNEMLDAGLIPFMGSKLAVQRRAERMMEQAATAKNASLVRGDMAGPFPQGQGVKLASERLGERIDPAMGGNLQTARASGPARAFITDAANTPDTFSAADKLKTGAYGSTNYATKAPDASKLKRATVSGYRQSIEDELNRLVPGEGDALKKANSRYGLAAQTADFAEEAAGREGANRKLGATELALGALGFSGGTQAGGLLGGGIAGLALPAAAHFAKTRGASTVAPLARLGSKGAAAAGRAANQSPAAATTIDNALENYLRPKDDEERQEEGAAWLKGL